MDGREEEDWAPPSAGGQLFPGEGVRVPSGYQDG